MYDCLHLLSVVYMCYPILSSFVCVAGSSSYREKTLSMSPSVASGDVFSEGSSTSDEEKRRSDSMERHPHSPDHLRGSVVSGHQLIHNM